MRIKLEAFNRLKEIDAENTDWFDSLTPEEQERYFSDHPHSKMDHSSDSERRKGTKNITRELDDTSTEDKLLDTVDDNEDDLDEYFNSLTPEEQEKLLSKPKRKKK